MHTRGNHGGYAGSVETGTGVAGRGWGVGGGVGKEAVRAGGEAATEARGRICRGEMGSVVSGNLICFPVRQAKGGEGGRGRGS